MSIKIDDADLKELDELISDIAKKNGVLITKDDPIAIAFIFNQYLMKQSKANQNSLIQNLKSDIQEIILNTLNTTNGIIEDSKKTSLKLVNEHISKSKLAISNAIEEAGNGFNEKNRDSAENIENTINASLTNIKNLIKILCALTFINIAIFIIMFFIR